MFGNKTKTAIILLALILSSGQQLWGADAPRRVNIGYFEGGDYPVHALLRSEFSKQLSQILPDSIEAVAIPEGYRSADWDRERCRTQAAELAAEKNIDLLIAMGPWVVHDLLEAGYDRPILAMHQFNVLAEGLIDSTGRPIAPNLTVHLPTDRIQTDLTLLTRLVDIERLGVLFFPSSDEKDRLISHFSAIGDDLGFEVVTAEGFDNIGTYAFFKAYNALDKKIDALYMPPAWGLDLVELREFIQAVRRDRIPVFTAEGKMLLERGAFATGSYYSVISEARFQADKTVRIMQGELPADLPVLFTGGGGLAINEETARQCGIILPQEVLNDFYVIEAPAPEETPYYTLNDAVSRALAANPGYLAQHDALEAATQAARQAYAAYLPQLSASAAFTHLDDNNIANVRNLLEPDQFVTQLNLRQLLFSLETIRAIEVAAKQRKLEDNNHQQARLDLELAVSLAYLNWLQAKEALAGNLKNRNLIELNLETAVARNRIEQNDTVDIIRLESDRYDATERVIDAKSELRVARVLLNALFNLPGNELFLLDTNYFAENAFWNREGRLWPMIENLGRQEQTEQYLVDQALRTSPKSSLQRLRVDLAKELLAQNKSRYFPTIGFKAGLDFSDRLKESATFEEEHTTWSISGLLSLPLFEGTDRIRERAKLKARLNEIEYQKDAVSLEIMRTVQSGVQNLSAHAHAMTAAWQARKRADTNLDLVMENYSAGRTPLLNLLDAQSLSLNADLAEINRRYQYFRSMARLVHALGWSVADDYSNFVEEFYRRAPK